MKNLRFSYMWTHIFLSFLVPSKSTTSVPCWCWPEQWRDRRSTSSIWRWCLSILSWTTRPALFCVSPFMLGLMLSEEREMERQPKHCMTEDFFIQSISAFMCWNLATHFHNSPPNDVKSSFFVADFGRWLQAYSGKR